MKILVAVKQVAFLDDEFEMRDDGRDVDADFFEKDLNEFDHFSVEEAMLIKEAAGDAAEVVIAIVGDEDADDALRTALAMVLFFVTPLLGLALTALLASFSAVAAANPYAQFTGAQSADFGSAVTGMALAGLLGWPHAAVVCNLDYAPGADTATLRRELEGGLEEIMTIRCPAVLSIQLGINQPRYASLRGIKQAKQKPVDELSLDDLGLSAADIAPVARVRKMYAPERGKAELITGSAAEQAARLAEIIKELRGM